MPTYGYRCTSCGHEFERFQKITDPAITECESCGAAVKKMIYPVGIQFKGSGFYVNDYSQAAGDSKQNGAASGKEESTGETKSETAGDSKSETKSDAAKPESKSESASPPSPASENKAPAASKP